MSAQRKKFSSQMDTELHRELQEYATKERVEFQQVLEEAGELFLQKKGLRKARPDFVALAKGIAEDMPDTLSYLAQ